VEPRQAAATLIAFALIGGLLQIFASVGLGTAKLDELTIAAQQGPLFYVVATLAIAVGIAVVWALRRRPLFAALVFVTWQAGILWPLSRRMSMLGLALHGEFILHHFLALVSALACLTLAWSLVRGAGKARATSWLVAGATMLAVLAGLGGHLAATMHVAKVAPTAHAITTTAAIFAIVVAVLVELRRAPRSATRWAAVALALPLVVRFASVGPLALGHAPVPFGMRGVFVGLLVLSAIALTVLLRPRPPKVSGIIMTSLAALTTATLYFIYRTRFGEVEDGLAPLAQSMLGFAPPYPEYLSNAAIVVVMLGGFLAVQTAGGAMTSNDARDRGIGLALVLVAGVGWSNPQLVLMSTAGALLFIGDLDELPTAASPPPRPIAEILAELATRLDLRAAEVGGAKRGVTLHALRGEVRGVTVDIRAEVGRGAPRVGARVGIVARARPEVGLNPGTIGEAPLHPIARTHRVFGTVRKLEVHGDELLDAALPFTTLRLGLWPAGAELDLGGDLSQLDAAALERLIVALAGAFAD
jgi:hypothetical protein